jgi:hypothetical protein
MIKIKSVKKMVESVSETEWDRAQDFAKSIGGDLSNKSPREMVAYLDRNGYELKNSEFISDTLLDLYGSGSDNLSWRIQRIVKKAGFSFRPDGNMDYSSRGLFSGICYGPKGEKRSIASLLSGKDLNDYMEWRDIVKKYSSWIKESKSIAKGKTRRIVEEEETYYKLNVHTKEITQRAKHGRTVNLPSGPGLGRPIGMSFSGNLCHIETDPGVKEGDAGFSVWIETKSLLDAIRQATERGEIEGGEK